MAGYPDVANLMTEYECTKGLEALQHARKTGAAWVRGDLQPVYRVLLEIRAQQSVTGKAKVEGGA